MVRLAYQPIVLARHLPDHEDVAHRRRGKELGGESVKLEVLRKKFPSPKISEFIRSTCHACHVIDTMIVTHATTPLLISAWENTPFTALQLNSYR